MCGKERECGKCGKCGYRVLRSWRYVRDVAGGGVGGVDEVLEGSYVTTERKEEEDEEATGEPSTCTCGEGRGLRGLEERNEKKADGGLHLGPHRHFVKDPRLIRRCMYE